MVNIINNENWGKVIDFTEIKKDGVDIEEVLLYFELFL